MREPINIKSRYMSLCKGGASNDIPGEVLLDRVLFDKRRHQKIIGETRACIRGLMNNLDAEYDLGTDPIEFAFNMPHKITIHTLRKIEMESKLDPSLEGILDGCAHLMGIEGESITTDESLEELFEKRIRGLGIDTKLSVSVLLHVFPFYHSLNTKYGRSLWEAKMLRNFSSVVASHRNQLEDEECTAMIEQWARKNETMKSNLVRWRTSIHVPVFESYLGETGVSYLGSGTYGSVFRTAYNPSHAIKFQKIDYDEPESAAYCELRSLHHLTCCIPFGWSSPHKVRNVVDLIGWQILDRSELVKFVQKRGPLYPTFNEMMATAIPCGYMLLVMEYIPNGTLDGYMRSKLWSANVMDLEELFDMVAQVLLMTHDAFDTFGFSHGDLRTDNIMLGNIPPLDEIKDQVLDRGKGSKIYLRYRAGESFFYVPASAKKGLMKLCDFGMATLPGVGSKRDYKKHAEDMSLLGYSILMKLMALSYSGQFDITQIHPSFLMMLKRMTDFTHKNKNARAFGLLLQGFLSSVIDKNGSYGTFTFDNKMTDGYPRVMTLKDMMGPVHNGSLNMHYQYFDIMDSDAILKDCVPSIFDNVAFMRRYMTKPTSFDAIIDMGFQGIKPATVNDLYFTQMDQKRDHSMFNFGMPCTFNKTD
jgi:serine/threonine protein kinase